MLRIVCLLIGYVFGNFQTAYLVGKKQGIDIRDHGSGNSGTTNALRVMGSKAGVIVFAGDMLKCLIAVLIITGLFGKSHPEIIYLLKLYGFLGCVLGHDFPFFMHFRGGKGVASAAGFVLGFHWTFVPVALIMFLVPFALTSYVSLGSILFYISLLVQMIIEGQKGFFAPASQAVLYEMYAIQAVLTAMALWQHRENIRRLIKGEENKTILWQKSE